MNYVRSLFFCAGLLLANLGAVNSLELSEAIWQRLQQLIAQDRYYLALSQFSNMESQRYLDAVKRLPTSGTIESIARKAHDVCFHTVHNDGNFRFHTNRTYDQHLSFLYGMRRQHMELIQTSAPGLFPAANALFAQEIAGTYIKEAQSTLAIGKRVLISLIPALIVGGAAGLFFADALATKKEREEKKFPKKAFFTTAAVVGTVTYLLCFCYWQRKQTHYFYELTKIFKDINFENFGAQHYQNLVDALEQVDRNWLIATIFKPTNV